MTYHLKYEDIQRYVSHRLHISEIVYQKIDP